MTGLHTSSLMVGLLCLVAAAIGAVALPGRGTHVPAESPAGPRARRRLNPAGRGQSRE